METLTAVKRILSHNEKTGEICFYGMNDVLYSGVSQYLPPKCPVKICHSDVPTKSGAYNFTLIECRCEDSGLAVEFLSSEAFFGIGTVTAQKFVDAYGAEIFDINTDAYQDADRTVLQRLKHLKCFESVYDYIVARGGTYYLAHLAYNKYGVDTIREIEKNPYSLLVFEDDSDFNICEHIAKTQGYQTHDKRRLKALIRLALKKNHDQGNTRIEFGDLVQLVNRIESRVGLYSTSALFIMETLINIKASIEKQDDKCFIALKSDYMSEVRIANAVRRLKNSAVKLRWDLLPIEELEKRHKIKYSSEQKTTFNCIKQSGIAIITGGPGTGKTTTINGLLEKYSANNPSAKIVLCAPTGRAAMRMSETTGRRAITIHKLLAIRPYKDCERDIVQRLDCDCLVVDEVSMVDSLLMARLLSAVKNGALVILLGDPEQLPSVSAGNVLHDFIDSGMIDTYRLKEVFRQGEHNSIIYNSSRVSQGKKDLKLDNNFHIYRVADESALIDTALKVTKRPSALNVYTAARKLKFASGTIALNRAIQKQKAMAGNFIEYGSYRFYVGDRVMFIKNNYNLNYFNGEEGTVIHVQKTAGRGKIVVKTDEDTITLSGELLNDIELSYAITAHKSQGSECDNALILIPKNPRVMLRRQLLYVEITRAKKNVVIITESDALENCIDNNSAIERNTGLKGRLLCTY